MTEQTNNRATPALSVSSSFITATTISLRCSPSFLSLIFKLTLTGCTGLLYSQPQNTQTKTQQRCMFFFFLVTITHKTHTRTLFSTSLLSSFCCSQRPILLHRLWSLLEVSYGVRNTMQICSCCCAFGPGNYLNPNKCYIINKHQTTLYPDQKESNTGLQESLFRVNRWYSTSTAMHCYLSNTMYQENNSLLTKNIGCGVTHRVTH